MAALQRPELTERLALDGSVPFASTPAEFGAFLRAEHAKWARRREGRAACGSNDLLPCSLPASG